MRQRGENPDCGRLARTIRAEHAEDRALGHIEVEPAESVGVAEGFVEADGLDHCVRHVMGSSQVG